jgi:hypothetical protein
MDYKDRIILQIAQSACDRVAKKVIRNLQRMTDCLSGDDSPLKNVWDEICVQVQYEESFMWEVYLEQIRFFTNAEVERLPPEIRAAIWLQTDQGWEWNFDHEDGESVEIDEGDIIEYILYEFILEIAANWTNKRIVKYLESPY